MNEASIHGHLILRWLAEAPLDVAALHARVAREFGAAPRFHTCDTRDLTLDALIALLSERGKIVTTAEGWRGDAAKVCADGE